MSTRRDLAAGTAASAASAAASQVSSRLGRHHDVCNAICTSVQTELHASSKAAHTSFICVQCVAADAADDVPIDKVCS